MSDGREMLSFQFELRHGRTSGGENEDDSQGRVANPWPSALQRAEVVFFMRPEEMTRTVHFLSRFKTAPVTAEIVDEAGAIFRKWNPSHGTDVNDAILGATAMRTGGRIYTLNTKHYPMPDLVVIRAWK